MTARKTLSRLLPLSLTLGLLAPACDGGSDNAAKKEASKASDTKDAAKADDAKPAEKPADAKPAEKPEEAAAAEKPEDAAAGEKPEEAAADEKPEQAEADEKPEEAEAEEKPEADDEKGAEPKKADTKAKADKPKPKADPPKGDAKPAASSADGKAIYLKKCKSCHGVSGAADTKLAQKHDIESWKEPGWKGKWSLSKIKDIVNNGKSGTKMKAFKTKLTPEEIEAVSAYSRSLGK